MNNFLAITYAFMLGFCPYDSVGFDDVVEFHNNPTHVQFELGVDILDCVKLYAGEETLQVMVSNLFDWFPYTQAYWIGVEYHKDFSEKFTLTVGANHKCQHPPVAWDEQYSAFNSSRTEIYLKVSGKVNIF